MSRINIRESLHEINFRDKVIKDVVSMSFTEVGAGLYNTTIYVFGFNGKGILDKGTYRLRVRTYLSDVYGITELPEQNNIIFHVLHKMGWTND